MPDGLVTERLSAGASSCRPVTPGRTGSKRKILSVSPMTGIEGSLSRSLRCPLQSNPSVLSPEGDHLLRGAIKVIAFKRNRRSRNTDWVLRNVVGDRWKISPVTRCILLWLYHSREPRNLFAITVLYAALRVPVFAGTILPDAPRLPKSKEQTILKERSVRMIAGCPKPTGCEYSTLRRRK